MEDNLPINITILIEIPIFFILTLMIMKYVWHPLSKIIKTRQNYIANGLAAGEDAHKELETARILMQEEINAAKSQARDIVTTANNQAIILINETREKTHKETQIQIQIAQEQLTIEYLASKQALQEHIDMLATFCAEKILKC